jgi:hypothetical protein
VLNVPVAAVSAASVVRPPAVGVALLLMQMIPEKEAKLPGSRYFLAIYPFSDLFPPLHHLHNALVVGHCRVSANGIQPSILSGDPDVV